MMDLAKHPLALVVNTQFNNNNNNNTSSKKEITRKPPVGPLEANQMAQQNGRPKAQQSALQYNGKQYDKIRVLGKGSFGTAIVHRRRADWSLVVLKEIDLQKFRGEHEKAIQEARIMSSLSHVNIIKYHNAYTTDSKLIIEMEYAKMGTLAAYLSFQGQPLEELAILITFKQISSGLGYLHSKNIIHLDLKMANIFVTDEGLVKIGDFGIAQYMNDSEKASGNDQHHLSTTSCNNNVNENQWQSGKKNSPASNTHLGTLAYSSPERCLGEATDFKSDIWSLGCILYELITGRPLFVADSLAELILRITRIRYVPIDLSAARVSASLVETFEQTIARDPGHRPSANDLLGQSIKLIERLQLSRHKLAADKTGGQNKSRHHHKHRLDLSTRLQASQRDNALGDQLNCLHSLVYQVSLDARHIHVDRVNLPQSKRIKEMAKGRSHYLVLTYDNIVYGWGAKSFGQLGACGLLSSASSQSTGGGGGGSSNSTSGNKWSLRRASRSARNSMSFREPQPTFSSCLSSPASSTQTIVSATSASPFSSGPHAASLYGDNNNNNTNKSKLSKQLVMSLLEDSKPTARPFVINELNHRKIIQVAAGNDFSVFLSKTGIVMTCGDGSSGCLGRGNLKSCFAPSMVESLLNTDVVGIASGAEHVVAICGNGRAFAWGKNRHGRLGIGGLAAASTGPETTGARSLSAQTKYVLRPQPVRFPNNGEEVFVKSVFCGDRSTVFVDSQNRCWACGENRFNKLGLDVKRRFRKTLIVGRCWWPREISSLGKYKIVACNIGRNHASYLSAEGKLIVFGQDIDHTYRLKSNIISARESHRRISLELSAKRRPQLNADKLNAQRQQQRSVSQRQLDTQSSLSNSQLGDLCFKQSKNLPAGQQLSRYNSARYKLNKLQRQQIDSYARKSRASRKMPFDCVISVSCTSMFTLALTSDNRVYFWGTRTYPSSDEQTRREVNPASTRDRRSRRQRDGSFRGCIDPQLVSENSDECFIKIGATNSSLMSNIQTLGSDQPIIHAQDPRLIANSLADLWILDYQPSVSSSSSSSISSLAEEGAVDGALNEPANSCCACCSSTKSSPSSSTCGSSCHSLDSASTMSLCSSTNCSCKSATNQLGCPTMRHDAILEPQPIVSLYIPSVFNNNGASLNLVDLFCLNDDRFYLILDTTIKVQPSQPCGRSTGGCATPPPPKPLRLNSLTEASQHQHQLRQASAGWSNETNNNHLPAAPADASAPAKGPSEQAALETELLEAVLNETRISAKQMEATSAELEADGREAPVASQGEPATGPPAINLVEAASNSNEDTCATAVTSSQGAGLSLEEPHSMSTFVAASLGQHIVVGPSMRTQGHCNVDQCALQPLVFDSPNGVAMGRRMTVCESLISGATKRTVRGERQMNGRRRSSSANQDTNGDSNTNVITSNDIDETSPMPSWVRNEYIQHQQLNGGAGEMFTFDGGSPSVPNSGHSSDESTLANQQAEVGLAGARHLQPLGILGSSSASSQLGGSQPSDLWVDYELAAIQSRAFAQPPPRGWTRGLSMSRSQADISGDPSAPNGLIVDMLDRRASIIDEVQEISASSQQVGVGRARENLLNCHVYKAASKHQYQSSNPNSVLSSRCNSHNQLIHRSNSSLRFGQRAYSCVSSPAGATDEPELVTFAPWSRELAELAAHNSHLLASSHSVEFQRKQQHQQEENRAGSKIGGSMTSLRKSFVKLFC